MARRIEVAGTFLGPKVRADDLLTEGSLLLVDPAHLAVQWPAGVPADLATVENIAWREAQSTLNNGQTQASVRPVFKKTATAFAAPLGLVERTTKGGLHGIPTQSAYVAQGDFAVYFNLPSALVDYIAAVSLLTPKHDIFFGMWRRITRAVPGVVSIIPAASFTKAPGASNFGQWITGHLPQTIPLSANRVGARSENPNVVGPAYGSIAGRPNATIVASDYDIAGQAGVSIARWGRIAPFGNVSPTHDNQWPSFVLYSVYIEDLNVSGRTYAAVDALYHAKYTADVLTAGGRYYGDTFTAPSALP